MDGSAPEIVDLLPSPTPMGIQTIATAISSDGKTVVGTGYGNGSLFFRWNAATGPVALDAAPYHSIPVGPDTVFLIWQPNQHVSARGDVVTATRSNDMRAPQAFRWTQAGGVVDLTGSDPSIVRDASTDGNRVLGSRVAGGNPVAGGGPGGPFSTTRKPFVWDEVLGARDLAILLPQAARSSTGSCSAIPSRSLATARSSSVTRAARTARRSFTAWRSATERFCKQGSGDNAWAPWFDATEGMDDAALAGRGDAHRSGSTH